MAKSMRVLLMLVLSAVIWVIAPSPGTASSAKFSNEVAWDDGQSFHFRISSASYPHMCVLIDNDANVATGYSWNGIGADYMIEDNKLYRYGMSSGSVWTWRAPLTSATASNPSSGVFEFSVPLASIGSPTAARVGFQGMDNSQNAVMDPNTINFVQGVSAGGGSGSSGGGNSLAPIQFGPNGFANEQATDDGGNFYFRAACSFPYPHFQVLIDTRTDSAGGYGVKGIVPDYMIQDDKLYHYVRSANGEPVWGAGDPVVARSTPGPSTVEFSVPLTAIGSPATAKVIFQGVDAGGNIISDPTLITFVRGSQPHIVGGNGPWPVDDSEAGWIFSGMVEVDDDGCKGSMEHAGGASTYAAYTFNGSGVEIYATTGPSIEAGGRTHKLGRMQILVDGKPAGQYSLFQTAVTYQSKVFAVTGLTRGNHVLQLEADSGWIDVDYIKIASDEQTASTGAPQ